MMPQIGRTFLFGIRNDSNEMDVTLTSLVRSIKFSHKKIVFSFLVSNDILTWLDKFNRQHGTLKLRLLNTDGSTLQDINFHRVIICEDSLETEIGHEIGFGASGILETTFHMSYDHFYFNPQVPNKDMRYLFKQFKAENTHAKV